MVNGNGLSSLFANLCSCFTRKTSPYITDGDSGVSSRSRSPSFSELSIKIDEIDEDQERRYTAHDETIFDGEAECAAGDREKLPSGMMGTQVHKEESSLNKATTGSHTFEERYSSQYVSSYDEQNKKSFAGGLTENLAEFAKRCSISSQEICSTNLLSNTYFSFSGQGLDEGEPTENFNESASRYSNTSQELMSIDEEDEESECIAKSMDSSKMESQQIVDVRKSNIAVERDKRQAVPSIEIDAPSPDEQPKSLDTNHSHKNSVVDSISVASTASIDAAGQPKKRKKFKLFKRSNSWSHQRKDRLSISTDEVDSISYHSTEVRSMSLDSSARQKKSKKFKPSKKLKLPKKKKKTEAHQELNCNESSPLVGIDSLADTVSMSSKTSSNMKRNFRSSSLFASLDDLSDEDICNE